MGEGYPRFRQAQRHRGPYRPRRGTRQARQGGSVAAQVISGCIVVGIASWTLSPQLISVWRTSSMSATEVEAAEQSVYYQGCDQARSAGAAPIYRGSPGYREGIDGDGDGIACEPHRGFWGQDLRRLLRTGLDHPFAVVHACFPTCLLRSFVHVRRGRATPRGVNAKLPMLRVLLIVQSIKQSRMQ